jgi:hypothetical protein
VVSARSRRARALFNAVEALTTAALLIGVGIELFYRVG